MLTSTLSCLARRVRHILGTSPLCLGWTLHQVCVLDIVPDRPRTRIKTNSALPIGGDTAVVDATNQSQHGSADHGIEPDRPDLARLLSRVQAVQA
jgi:hypothetical protein